MAPGTLGAILAEDLYFSEDKVGTPAFAAPPTTSSRMIHPLAFDDGETALPVEPPPADGEIFDEGIFGEYMLYHHPHRHPRQ